MLKHSTAIIMDTTTIDVKIISLLLLFIYPTFNYRIHDCARFGIEAPLDCTCDNVHRKGVIVKCRDIQTVPNSLDFKVKNQAGNNRVFALDLSYNQLKHTIKIVNGDVKLVNLGHNLIQTVRQGDFMHAPKLHFLDLSFNNLTYESLEETLTGLHLLTLVATSNSIRSFSNLDIPKSLRYLHLDGNPIEDFQEFLPNLIYLKVSMVPQGSLPRAMVSQMSTSAFPSLETLHIVDTPLALDPMSKDSFGELVNLTELHLTQCSLSYFGPEAEDYFSGLGKSLRTLWMNKNSLEEVPYHSLKYLKYLQELNLAHNRIKHIERRSFEGTSLLTKLDLSYNSIDYLDRFTFAALEGLTWLDLESNSIREIPEGTFSHLHHMNYLNLAANKLTSLHPDSFEPYAMQDIRISIMIGRNPWHCDCNFKWVIDHATWDENAYDFFWEPQAEKGRFYEIIKEINSQADINNTSENRKSSAKKGLFPLTWFTQCKSPKKYRHRVMHNLIGDKHYDHVCGHRDDIRQTTLPHKHIVKKLEF